MDSHSNASDPPGLSADAVVAYLLAGHLQIAYGAVPAGVERADTLCALRARLVRAAESALPFRLSPALDDGTTDAPDDPVESATMLLGEPSSGPAVSGAADAAEADVDGELVDALSDTLAFAWCLRALWTTRRPTADPVRGPRPTGAIARAGPCCAPASMNWRRAAGSWAPTGRHADARRSRSPRASGRMPIGIGPRT